MKRPFLPHFLIWRSLPEEMLMPWDTGNWDEGTWDADPISDGNQTKQKHTKHMPRQPFMPASDPGKQTLLTNFVAKLKDPAKGYATKYSVPAATITLLDNGRLWFDAIMAHLADVRTYSQSLTALKNAIIEGSGPLTAPVPPVFTAPNVPLVAGIFTLLASVAQGIKSVLNYEVADGEDLGIEGAEIAELLATIAPDLSKSRITSGGLVEIVWKKGGHTGVKIFVDRGDGKAEVFLAVDTQPNYIDTVKPAPGQTAIYTYRAIYLDGDTEFGQMSQPFQITVRG